MSDGIADEGNQHEDYRNGYQQAFGPRVPDVLNPQAPLYREVGETDKHAVESEDEHRAKRYHRDDAQPQAVEAARQIDNAIHRQQVNGVIEGDVQAEAVLVDVPVEESDARQQGGQSYGEVTAQPGALEQARLPEQVTHEEEAQAAHKPVEGDVGGKVILFVGTIQQHTEQRERQHDSLSVTATVAEVGDDVHQQQREEEPGHPVELAGETGVQLSEQRARNGLQKLRRAEFSLLDGVLGYPVGIVDGVIYNIRYKQRAGVFLQRLLCRGGGLLQVAGDEKERREDDRCQILQVESILLLWQMAEHHHRHAEGFCPVYPVHPVLHESCPTYILRNNIHRP